MSSSLSGVITSTLLLCRKCDPEAMINLILIFAHREKTYIKPFSRPGQSAAQPPLATAPTARPDVLQVPGPVVKESLFCLEQRATLL